MSIQHARELRAAGYLIALIITMPAHADSQLIPTGQPLGYFGGEGGWTGLESQQASIPSVPGKTGPQAWAGGFDVGARAGVEWGSWRFEGEFRYQQNGDDTIARHPAKGDRTAYALLTNAIYDLDIGLPFSPHVGGGVGRCTDNSLRDGLGL